MEFRLFFTTFALIFLAELGDKTQLASMAASAGSKSPWSVFAGAAMALLLSTLLATLLGSTLQRFLPQQYLRGGAAVLFFLFGAILLISAFRVKPETEAAPAKPGALSRLVTAVAADFERASAVDYEKLAAQTSDHQLQEVFLHLAEEERSHLSHVRSTAEQMAKIRMEANLDARTPPAVISKARPTHASSRAILDSAIRHEQDTAAFYHTLARIAPLPGTRSLFARLALEEQSHVAHLIEYRDTGETDVSRKHT